MNPDNTNKTSSSGATSAPRTTTETPAISEEAYLHREALRAKLAMQKVLKELTSDLGAVADPRVLTRAHPVLSLGAAAIAGFVAGATVTSSKRQQVLQQLHEIQKALAPADPDLVKKRSTLITTLVSQAVAIVQPMILSAMVTPPPTAEDVAGNGNGHSESPASEAASTPSDPA